MTNTRITPWLTVHGKGSARTVPRLWFQTLLNQLFTCIKWLPPLLATLKDTSGNSLKFVLPFTAACSLPLSILKISRKSAAQPTATMHRTIIASRQKSGRWWNCVSLKGNPGDLSEPNENVVCPHYSETRYPGSGLRHTAGEWHHHIQVDHVSLDSTVAKVHPDGTGA